MFPYLGRDSTRCLISTLSNKSSLMYYLCIKDFLTWSTEVCYFSTHHSSPQNTKAGRTVAECFTAHRRLMASEIGDYQSPVEQDEGLAGNK